MTLVSMCAEATCWMRTGERQASRLRSTYLRAILRQNQGFFDTAGADTAEVVNSVTTDTLTIQDAISEKVLSGVKVGESEFYRSLPVTRRFRSVIK